MKIRIKGNSIRFRLSKPEVEYFGRKGRIEKKTEFGNNDFKYVLAIKKSGSALSTDFLNGTITMWIPEQMATTWTTSDLVGYQVEQETAAGKKLYLLLEKDYKCLDQVAEDQSGNYENPLLLRCKS